MNERDNLGQSGSSTDTVVMSANEYKAELAVALNQIVQEMQDVKIPTLDLVLISARKASENCRLLLPECCRAMFLAALSKLNLPGAPWISKRVTK